MSVNLVNKDTGELTSLAGATMYADAPIGSIIPYGGATAPSGWLLCQGQAVSRTTYAELFAIIGTNFGEGDGSTTFNVPDLRESTTKGVGLSGNSENHYSENGVTLGEFIEDRIQSHTHGVQNGYDGSNEGSAERGDARHGYSIRTNNATGRTGNTTEVKAVGVNYIIKAKMVAMPSDFMSKVDEAVASRMETDVSVSTDGYFRGWTDAQGIKHVRYKREFANGAVMLNTGNQNVVMGSLTGLDSKYQSVIPNYTSVGLVSFTPYFSYGNNLVICHHQIWKSDASTNTYSVRIGVAGSGSYSNVWGIIAEFREDPT